MGENAPEKRSPGEKIPEERREYQDFLELAPERKGSGGAVFGASEIATIQRLKEILVGKDSRPSNPQLSHFAKQEIARLTDGLKEKILRLAANPRKESQESIWSFLEESLANKTTAKKLKPFLGKDTLAHDLAAIPVELYIEMAKRHIAEFAKKERKFEKYVPLMNRLFLDGLWKQSERIGFSFEGKVVEKRVGQAIIHLSDTLTATLEERWGSFDADHNTVIIAENVPDELKLNVFSHEMLHLISGRTIMLWGEEEGIGEIRHQRIGTRFKASLTETDRRKRKTSRFRWLNEAITEMLAAEISGVKDPFAYGSEQDIVRELANRGKQTIGWNLFFNAYFENYDPGLPPEERIRAWKNLRRAINEAYTPDFLVALDDCIRRQGADFTRELLRRDWYEIFNASKETKE
jgi:hypothetical protein